jgi:hypothetical protein
MTGFSPGSYDAILHRTPGQQSIKNGDSFQSQRKIFITDDSAYDEHPKRIRNGGLEGFRFGFATKSGDLLQNCDP